MSKKLVWGGIALGVAILTIGGGLSANDDTPRDNTPPSSVCEDFDLKSAGEAQKVVIGAGETVSGAVIAPLANELGVEMDDAERMVKKANPGVYNIDNVGAGQQINKPNCTQP